MLLVKEVEPGVFRPWDGTNELPGSIRFTMSDEDLASHGLYRVEENTTPPSPYHEPIGVVVERVDGVVVATCQFALTQDLDGARVMASSIVQRSRVAAETLAMATWPYAGDDADIVAAFDAKELEHTTFISTASVADLVLRTWDWPTVDDLP